MLWRAMPVCGLLLLASPACSLLLSAEDPGEEIADAAADAPPEVECETGWSLSGGGASDGADAITRMVTDQCDTFICGTYTGVLELFEPPPISFGVGTDVVVARIDASGTVAWMHGIGGSLSTGDSCQDLAVSDDSVAIVGDFTGMIQSPVDGAMFGSSDRDGFVAVYSRDLGAPQMFATLDGDVDDTLSAVAFDGAALYLGGFASSDMPTFDTAPLSINTGSFILRVDQTGAAGALSFGGMTPDSRTKAIIIDSNEIFLGVNVGNLERFSGGAGCTFDAEGTGAVIARLSAALECLQIAVIDSSSDDTIEAMTRVGDRIIVAGNTSSGLTAIGADVVDEGGGGIDGYYLELAFNLAIPRLRIYGSNNDTTRFRSVAHDPSTNRIAILADFAGVWAIDNQSITSQAFRDLALLTFADAGDLIVENVDHFRGIGDETGAAARFRDGALVIAGSYDQELSVRGAPLPPASSPDLFVVAP